MSFDSLEKAISDIKQGKIIILVDDKDRENEGDLCCAAEKVTPDIINFMTKYGRGLVCLSITPQISEKLGLKLMTPHNTSRYGTNFTVSIEAAKGVTTGISAQDRAHTIQTAIQNDANFYSISTPGHIFPVLYREGGVLRRAGQTEGSVDLAKMAGLQPTGVICEIMNEDGTMARREDLKFFAKKHNLTMISIAQIIESRMKKESFLQKSTPAKLPTSFGDFQLHGFKNTINDEEYIALTMGSWEKNEAILTRVHSQCITGDIFFSLKCDCRNQLQRALKKIAEAKKGVLLYLPQEGRGIGIFEKARAYHLQDQGYDTVEANIRLGFKPDLRDYGFGAQALVLLGVQKMKLMTNNPKKIVGLEGYGLEIVERIPIKEGENPKNIDYLNAKKNLMGHLI
jgi:3,4-dihydroxy 2-butanone 4-phosphate synthase/GTP cyclohydrolase II